MSEANGLLNLLLLLFKKMNDIGDQGEWSPRSKASWITLVYFNKTHNMLVFSAVMKLYRSYSYQRSRLLFSFYLIICDTLRDLVEMKFLRLTI